MPSRSSGPLQQDWDPVVIHKRPGKISDARNPKVVNAALRAGVQVVTEKKFDAGNKKFPTTVIDARKLDQESEPAPLDRVAPEVRQAIQKARTEKKLTQAQLAQQIHEQLKIVQEYEAGKAVPNHQVLAKLEKVLGVKLRGKLK